MAGILERAAQMRLERVQLLADKHNWPALDFYRHKGWHTTDLVVLRHVGKPQPPDLPQSHPDPPLLGPSEGSRLLGSDDVDVNNMVAVDDVV